MSKVIKGYTLVNDVKVRRAYDRELGAGAGATDEQVLQQYAKFGGLIKKGDEIVDNGLFWDFVNKRPVETKKEVKEEVKVVEPKKEVKKVKRTK